MIILKHLFTEEQAPIKSKTKKISNPGTPKTNSTRKN